MSGLDSIVHIIDDNHIAGISPYGRNEAQVYPHGSCHVRSREIASAESQRHVMLRIENMEEHFLNLKYEMGSLKWEIGVTIVEVFGVAFLAIIYHLQA